jgi:LAO/AO transport system kinase
LNRGRNEHGADGAALGRRLRERDLSAAPAALNLLEQRAVGPRSEASALLREVSPQALGGEAPAHVVGLTGPPGAGKSSLLSALVATWRGAGQSVAVLAVDPSSKRSGGSLLGDRARIEHDPEDSGVLIRSTAAGARLGGLAPPTRAAVQALAAAFDMVVVETVGVGQSETDVEDVADTVVVVVQPGAGDTLQFLKAGIMEVPDVLVITKADHGDPARRSQRDLEAALDALGSEATPVLAVSSVPPTSGIDELSAALANHRETLDVTTVRADARRRAALAEFAAERGERGIRALGGRRAVTSLLAEQQAGADMGTLLEVLERHAAGEESSTPSSPGRER